MNKSRFIAAAVLAMSIGTVSAEVSDVRSSATDFKALTQVQADNAVRKDDSDESILLCIIVPACDPPASN